MSKPAHAHIGNELRAIKAHIDETLYGEGDRQFCLESVAHRLDELIACSGEATAPQQTKRRRRTSFDLYAVYDASGDQLSDPMSLIDARWWAEQCRAANPGCEVTLRLEGDES